MSTYQGSANEDVCLMDREWEPEVPFKPARCSEPEWGTKEQCEQESTWVFPVEAKDAYCSDGYSITDEGCQAYRK